MRTNYRLPDKCCNNCAAHTFNSYDDLVCSMDKEVCERGAVCDGWHDITQPCSTCKHSFFKGTKPWCSIGDEEVIPTDTCTSWEAECFN